MILLPQISTNSWKTVISRQFLLTALIFLGMFRQIDAQQLLTSADDKEQALYHLSQLEKGTLIILLKGDKKKREELQRVIQSESSTAAQRKHARKQYDASVENRKNFQLELAQALRSFYSFSDYRLLYDHDLQLLLDHSETNFLNDSLEVSQSISISDTSATYLLKEEYQDGVLSFVLYDFNSNQIPYPAPTVKLTPAGPALIFRSIFNNSDYRKASNIVERFDHTLHERLEALKLYKEKQSEKARNKG